MMNTKKIYPLFFAAFTAAGCSLLMTGCSGAAVLADSAGAKNIDAEAYGLFGKVESVSSETVSPTGKLLIGRLSYHSRKVGISSDEKVPATARFRSSKTKTLFGTEEEIVEYDFSAPDETSAEKARTEIRQLLTETEK